MNGKNGYHHVLRASYIGYVTQAIVNNLSPLLFLTFQAVYGISLKRITFLISMNFGIQLLVDMVSAGVVDRIGYKACIVSAHICSAAGVAGMAIFPEIFSSPYAGLAAATVCYAIGGGLIEVLISPIVEACPTKKKEASMSLLHSFYCWGQVLVVAGSTLYFAVFGKESWRWLCVLWALVPMVNAWYFSRLSVPSPGGDTRQLPIKELLSEEMFWVFAFLMVCAGASELAMSQWASAFAESGLRVSKTVGDLAGPCMFAALMGTSRVIHARFSDRVPLNWFMLGSSLLCVASYLLAVFSPVPVFSLAGCGLCGLSVGVLWPGTFSLAAKGYPGGGTAMFALLALAGDLGCSLGPAVVGFASVEAGTIQGGLLMAVLFPIALFLGVMTWNVKKI